MTDSFDGHHRKSIRIQSSHLEIDDINVEMNNPRRLMKINNTVQCGRSWLTQGNANYACCRGWRGDLSEMIHNGWPQFRLRTSVNPLSHNDTTSPRISMLQLNGGKLYRRDRGDRRTPKGSRTTRTNWRQSSCWTSCELSFELLNAFPAT